MNTLLENKDRTQLMKEESRKIAQIKYDISKVNESIISGLFND